MNLHLVLTYHWFDETASGRKRTEYREMGDFWNKRIWLNREIIETVTFARGYTSDTMTFDVEYIDVGTCPYPEWDGAYYRIHFKEKL